MSPLFRDFLILILGLSLLVLAMQPSRADTLITPYYSMGLGHRLCPPTDPLICDNPNMGSDTTGYLEAGLYTQDVPYVDRVSLSWKHQSYADRGRPSSGNEAELDAVALQFMWEFKSLQFRLPW